MANVSLTGDDAAPKARTFFSSDTSTDLSAVNDHMADTETITILYDADDTPLSASARNLAGNSGPLLYDLEGFAANATAGWDFFASGWYWDGTSAPPEFIRNRVFQGFNPPGDYTTVFNATVIDGDDCGQTLEDHNGNNPSLACQVSPSTYYFLEVNR